MGILPKVKKKISNDIMSQINAENKRDIISTFFAVPWQVVLFLTGMAVILKRWDQFSWLIVILALLSIGLYFNWFRHLSKEVNVDKEP